MSTWPMFNRIANRYDWLNRILSMGIDKSWRRKLATYLPQRQGLKLLDLATGTGDVVFSVVHNAPNRFEQATGVDMSEKMLDEATQKNKKVVSATAISFQIGDATSLTFKDKSFDVLTMAFGIRNVEDVPACLKEMTRVLGNNGKALILEFSLPKNFLFRWVYLFYFRYILPFVGGIVSGDREAYVYLNKSVESFPYGNDFLKLMDEAGFKSTRCVPLSGGIASLYIGEVSDVIT